MQTRVAAPGMLAANLEEQPTVTGITEAAGTVRL